MSPGQPAALRPALALALAMLAVAQAWPCAAAAPASTSPDTLPPQVSAPAEAEAPFNPPRFEAFRARWQPSDRVLLDRHGQAIGSKRVDASARRLAWVALADTSPAVIEAVLAAEDQRYFWHDGVDWPAVAAATAARFWQQALPAGQADARQSTVRGASSISMQVAALLDPALARAGGPRSLGQKWQQMQAALALEQRWTKPQILETYLNSVGFRGELQGLGAASLGLFGKAPSGLDKAEAAVLAALIRAPNAAPAVVARRACAILAQTRGTPAPGEPGCDAPGIGLLLTEARLAPQAAPALAPHTAQRLLALPPHAATAPSGSAAQAAQVMAGAASPSTDVHSSLDAGIQRLAREALAAQMATLAAQGAEDAAAVVLHNRTGEVLAHVGSSGRFSRAAQVDAADAPRQAGSTLKPLLYALAFDQQRLSPSTLLDDSPLALATDAGLYTPQNYDQRFVGPVSVRRALASSLNIPAVRTVGLTGVPEFHQLLQALGLSTLGREASFYGPSLALGSGDVTLLGLTNAYRALANGGLASPLRWLPVAAPAGGPAQATTASPGAATAASAGPMSLNPDVRPHRVLGAASAWLVGHILADNSARAGTFGFDSVLATPQWSAVKTGTSKDMRDNWCIGWSEHYTVGVWVGNASGAPMHAVSGVSGAAPAWAEIMRGLHRQLPSRPPAPPPGLVARSVVFEDAIEPGRSDWFMAALAPPAAADGSPHQVALARPAGAPRIVSPTDGTLLAWDPDIPAAMQGLMARLSRPVDGAQWLLDGQPVGQGVRAQLVLQPGAHRLRVLAADGSVVDEVRFEVRGMPRSALAQAASRAENSGSALLRGR